MTMAGRIATKVKQSVLTGSSLMTKLKGKIESEQGGKTTGKAGPIQRVAKKVRKPMAKSSVMEAEYTRRKKKGGMM